MLQRIFLEEVKARRKSEYKEWKKKVRELIKESKRRMNYEFGRKMWMKNGIYSYGLTMKEWRNGYQG